MSAPLSVNATIGDISIEFKDSCNCCCYGEKEVPPSTPIYINSSGQAEKFKFDRRSDYTESLERSYNHLAEYLKALDHGPYRPSRKIHKQLKKENIVNLNETPKEPLTLEKIQKINTLLVAFTRDDISSCSGSSTYSTQSSPF